MIDLDSTVKNLQRQLILSRGSLQEAERGWRLQAKALASGLDVSAGGSRKTLADYIAHRDHYLGIARYCEDAERLIDFHNSHHTETDNLVQLMAVDPHILLAYAEPWDSTNHTGFFFSKVEADKIKNASSNQFVTFVYHSVFSRSPCIILNSGKPEISQMFSHFQQQAMQEGSLFEKSGPLLDPRVFMAQLQEIYQDQEGKGLTDLRAAFEHLILVGGTPHLKQKLALARLIGVMKRQHFFQPEAAVRQAMAEKGYEPEIERFSAVLNYVRNNPAFLNGVRKRFFDAYSTFRETEDTLEKHGWLSSGRSAPLRGGELDDVNAMLEVHVLNSVLSTTGVPLRINYVTLSPRMFDFTRQFDASVLRTPLIHPRSAMMVHQSDIFDDHRDEMTNVLANAIAFSRTIPFDKEIRVQELNDFEDKFGHVLEATRNTFMHSSIDSAAERSAMIESVRRIFNGEEFTQDETIKLERLLDTLESGMKEQVRKAGISFTREASALASQAWTAYRQFASQDDQRRPINLIFRRYISGSSNRVLCMPIDGAFRYMFALHNSELDDLFPLLKDNRFIVMDISDFLELIDDSVGDQISDNSLRAKKSSSLRFFARAIFAASHRQWTLAESLASQAMNELETDFKLAKDVVEKHHQFSLRATQLKQEILMMRHLCRRALAQANEPGRRRKSWLRRAAQDLFESASVTKDLSREDAAFSAEFNPVSVRQTLAAIGLQIEWLVQSEGDAEEQLRVLPEATRTDICWSGIRNLSGSGFTAQSLADATQETISRIARAYEDTSVKDGDPNDLGAHAPENWRYFLVRAKSMHLLISAVGDSGLLLFEPSGVDEYELTSLANLRDEHLCWIDSLLSNSQKEIRTLPTSTIENRDNFYRELKASRNPFLDSLISAASIRQNARWDEDGACWRSTRPADLFGAFATMDVNCNVLDPDGFPRQVIRAVKKKYSKALIDQLEAEYGED